jgi:hypothetical protein
MDTIEIVDKIMKDHLSDASDAVKEIIMNKAAEVLAQERQRVGASLFQEPESTPEETTDETDHGTD